MYRTECAEEITERFASVQLSKNPEYMHSVAEIVGNGKELQ